MREYAKKPESQSRTLDNNPKASRQAPINVILQQYKERNIQRYAKDKELAQGKFDTMQPKDIDEEELLQGKFASDYTSEQESIQREEKTNNTGLPDNLKSGIENLSGFSMDDVKMHYNSDKPAQLNAFAYAQGTDIHVALGQEKHLPHEAWHVVQQMQGRVQPTVHKQGVSINDNEALEHEADVMGERIVQRKLNFHANTEYLDNSKNQINNKPFEKVQNKARALYTTIDLDFVNKKPSSGAAAFEPFLFGGGIIKVDDLSEAEIIKKSYDYNSRLVEVGHETQHAIDHFEEFLPMGNMKDKIISEFRAFAVQSAISIKLIDEEKNVSQKYRDMQQSFSSENGFKKDNLMFNIIKAYMKLYSDKEDISDSDTEKFIQDNHEELDRARQIYLNLKEDKIGEHDFITEIEYYKEDGETIKIDDDIEITEILTKSRRLKKEIPTPLENVNQQKSDFHATMQFVRSETEIQEYTRSILNKILKTNNYLDGDNKAIDPKTINIELGTDYAAIPGLLFLPAVATADTDISNGTFELAIMHELGHYIRSKKKDSQFFGDIETVIASVNFEAEIAKNGNPEGATKDKWEEEVRADLKGIKLRFIHQSKLPSNSELSNFEQMLGNAVDANHPPAQFRVEIMKRYVTRLEEDRLKAHIRQIREDGRSKEDQQFDILTLLNTFHKNGL